MGFFIKRHAVCRWSDSIAARSFVATASLPTRVTYTCSKQSIATRLVDIGATSASPSFPYPPSHSASTKQSAVIRLSRWLQCGPWLFAEVRRRGWTVMPFGAIFACPCWHGCSFEYKTDYAKYQQFSVKCRTAYCSCEFRGIAITCPLCSLGSGSPLWTAFEICRIRGNYFFIYRIDSNVD